MTAAAASEPGEPAAAGLSDADVGGCARLRRPQFARGALRCPGPAGSLRCMSSPTSASARAERRARIAAAEELADEQCGVVSRRQLCAAGVTRWQVRAQVGARRWQRPGLQTVAVRTGQLDEKAERWVAVLETCPAAALAGVSALLEAGLKGVSERIVHDIAPKSSRPRRPPGVRVHESRRDSESDVLTNGVRRVRTPVAVVQAALWAASDRQAALFVVTSVQQRLVLVGDVSEALTAVRRHRRRRFLLQLPADVADGAHSLGELDLTAALRRRGLPPPSRQVVRRLRAAGSTSTPSGSTTASGSRSTAFSTSSRRDASPTHCGTLSSRRTAPGPSGCPCWFCGSTRKPCSTGSRRSYGPVAGEPAALPPDGAVRDRCVRRRVTRSLAFLGRKALGWVLHSALRACVRKTVTRSLAFLGRNGCRG